MVMAVQWLLQSGGAMQVGVCVDTSIHIYRNVSNVWSGVESLCIACVLHVVQGTYIPLDDIRSGCDCTGMYGWASGSGMT